METEVWCERIDSVFPCCIKDTKYLCFLVTKAIDRQHVKPKNLVLALTRHRDFLVERGVTSLSLPVYDPKRGKLHPRELYALTQVMILD